METISIMKKRHAKSIQCRDNILQDSDDLLQGFQVMFAELLNDMQEVKVAIGMQRSSICKISH